jgi:quercetin dioxygenase-like cupin family protein
MYYYHPSDRQEFEISSGINARTFWGENIMLAIVDIDPGAILPKHSHPHEQAGIVLEGKIEFNIAGEIKLLHPGDCYIIPGEVEHTVTVGEAPVKVLDIFSPVREDLKY